MTRHFGVLIQTTNTTVEIEYTRMLPPTLQAHIGRLGKGSGNTPFSPSRDEDVAYQSHLLGTAKVEVLALAQTSASLFDDDYDTKVNRLMSEGAGVPSMTSAEAIGRAVRALGMTRIALVTPYSREVIERAKSYYETRYGLTVVAMEGFGATDAYAIGGLSADNATDAFARIDRPDIEVLVVPGGNFPTMPAIQGWERRFAKPVVTTNQAALWGMLEAMKITDPLPGLGRLLEQRPTDA